MLLHAGVRIVALVVAPALFSVSLDHDASARPRLSSVEPQVAAPAEIVTARGVYLDRSRVVELILSNSDGKAITHIVEQRPDLIRFRVPRTLGPGKYQIVLVVDSRWGTELIDQDIVLTVVSVGTDRGALGSRSRSAAAFRQHNAATGSKMPEVARTMM